MIKLIMLEFGLMLLYIVLNMFILVYNLWVGFRWEESLNEVVNYVYI